MAFAAPQVACAAKSNTKTCTVRTVLYQACGLADLNCGSVHCQIKDQPPVYAHTRSLVLRLGGLVPEGA